MGIEGIVPRRRTTTPHPGHKKYPYLLRNLDIFRPDQVWCSDITSIPMQHGFLYLVAVMDWFSRYVLSWRLSNTLEGTFCLEALEEALSIYRAQGNAPKVFETLRGIASILTTLSREPAPTRVETRHADVTERAGVDGAGTRSTRPGADRLPRQRRD